MKRSTVKLNSAVANPTRVVYEVRDLLRKTFVTSAVPGHEEPDQYETLYHAVRESVRLLNEITN